ncbi:MAG: hypothetical protein OXC62_02580 [Aestuariivita sp.]|nr:hypothetical protein [Aestuariivita sp.]
MTTTPTARRGRSSAVADPSPHRARAAAEDRLSAALDAAPPGWRRWARDAAAAADALDRIKREHHRARDPRQRSRLLAALTERLDGLADELAALR